MVGWEGSLNINRVVVVLEGSLKINHVVVVLGCIGRVLEDRPWSGWVGGVLEGQLWDGWVGRDISSGTECTLSAFVADAELCPWGGMMFLQR